MSDVTHIIISEDEAGMRLDRWFKSHYPGVRFGHLQKLLRSGQIRVDGGRAKTNFRLEAGQDIRIPPRMKTDYGSPPLIEAAKINSEDEELIRGAILYEDDALIVLNKPPGLAVQGGSKTTRHIDGMLDIFGLGDERPKLVHRLDRGTSGVLLLAKNRASASKLGKEFRSRSARKIYWALTIGVPRPLSGEISTHLKKLSGPFGETVQVVKQGEPGAQHSHSVYSVIEQAGQKVSWVALAPTTGRTHQLRVHMAELGVPILGDAKYFIAQEGQEVEGLSDKLHLHAQRLTIPHPDGKTLDIAAPLPDHMRQSFKSLGLDESQYNPNWYEDL